MTSRESLIKQQSFEHVIFLGGGGDVIYFDICGRFGRLCGLWLRIYWPTLEAARSCQKLVSGKVHGVTIQKTPILIPSLFCQSPSYVLIFSLFIVAYLNSPLSVLHSDNSGHIYMYIHTNISQDRAGSQGISRGIFGRQSGNRKDFSLTILYLLIYSMVQSPSWEANWFAASQEIPRISRNPKVHYRTHKRQHKHPACDCFLT